MSVKHTTASLWRPTGIYNLFLNTIRALSHFKTCQNTANLTFSFRSSFVTALHLINWLLERDSLTVYSISCIQNTSPALLNNICAFRSQVVPQSKGQFKLLHVFIADRAMSKSRKFFVSQTLDESEWKGFFFMGKNSGSPFMFSKVKMYCRTISRLP